MGRMKKVPEAAQNLDLMFSFMSVKKSRPIFYHGEEEDEGLDDDPEKGLKKKEK